MNILKKTISMLMLFLMLGFVAVGYATLADDLNIGGAASIAPQAFSGIRIIDLDVVSTTGGVSDTNAGKYINPTTLESDVLVRGAGTITYKITVENNTDATYWYRNTLFIGSLDGYQNGLINASGGVTILTKDKLEDSGDSFNTEDWIPPHTVREFYAIYSYGSAALGAVRNLVNFSFGAKLVSYGDEFLAILNTPERYQILADSFNDMHSENGTTVIANTGADVELFDTLFESSLELNGSPVHIMIERKNVDGKTTGDSYSTGNLSGCEYTVYLTTDDPTTGNPVVYAVSYTTNPDGSWRQIGELYDGTAPAGTYVDSDGVSHPSFDIDEWEAIQKTYTVFSYGGRIVRYTVNNRYGNSFQQQKTIEELMSIEDIELYNQLDDHPIMKDSYKVLKNHEGSTATEVVMLRDAYNAAMKYYNMYNNGQEFKVIRGVYTRAEIIASLEALAHAMEYYQQTHHTDHN